LYSKYLNLYKYLKNKDLLNFIEYKKGKLRTK
jgi:hypothetical protein